MQSVCVNDASFEGEMPLLKGFFFFCYLAHKRGFFWTTDRAEAGEISTNDAHRQRMPGAAALTAAMARVPVPTRPGAFVSSESRQLAQVFGTFPRSGAQPRAEGCAPANPPTDAVYTMLTQRSCMAAVVCVCFIW